MKPLKQIGKKTEANINLLPGSSGAEHALWAYRNDNSRTFTSRWKLTWRERLSLALKGSVWLTVMTNGHPPVRIDVNEPDDLLC